MAVTYPFGDYTGAAMTATGDQDITVSNSMTIIDGASVSATGNRTLNIAAASTDALRPGWLLAVVSKTDGTETLTFGTGIEAPVLTGVAGKSFSQLFMWNGTAYIALAPSVQID